MDPEALRTQLAALHAELGRIERVDPPSVLLLREIMDDIKRLMEQPTESAARTGAAAPPGTRAAPPGTRTEPPGTRTAPPSLTERLEKVAVQFEADHPTLAASSRRLVDLLGKAGL